LAAALFVGCISVLVVGCGGKKSEPLVEPEPELSPEEVAAETERRRLSSIKASLDRVKKQIKRDPTDFFTNMDNLRGVLYGAGGTKYDKEVRALIEAQEEGLRELAEEQLDALVDEAAKHSEKEDWDEAERVLTQYEQNEEAYSDLPAWQRYEEMIDEVKTSGMAEREARLLLAKSMKFKRQGEVARAIGMLIAFPDKFTKTRHYGDVKAQIASFMEEYEVMRNAQAKEDAIAFTELVIDEFLSNFDHVMRSGDEDVWEGVDEVAEGDNDGESPAPLVLGTEEWEHWSVEFTVKFSGDVPFRLGITMGVTRFSSGKQQWATYPFPDLDEDTWHTIRVTLSDGEFDVRDVSTGTKLKDSVPKANATGGLAFFLMPGQKMFVKDIKFKVTSKIELNEGKAKGEDVGEEDDGDDDEDDGK